MERVYTTPLIDKLGVRPGAQVAIDGVDDAAFELALRDRTDRIVHLTPAEEPPADLDLVFLAAEHPVDLDRLRSLRRAIVVDGAIWVVSPKGRAATLRDVEVMAAARAADLVDNKVVSFSPTHTALRLVIPRRLRGV